MNLDVPGVVTINLGQAHPDADMNDTKHFKEAWASDARLIDEHHDVVEAHHIFRVLSVNGADWDLSHLRAFAFRIDPDLGFKMDVVVDSGMSPRTQGDSLRH